MLSGSAAPTSSDAGALGAVVRINVRRFSFRRVAGNRRAAEVRLAADAMRLAGTPRPSHGNLSSVFGFPGSADGAPEISSPFQCK